MKPKAYSLRLTFSTCEYSCRVSQPGWGLSAEALVGLRSAPRHWLRRSGVRDLRCGFGWQSPHKRLQHGPYTRSCLMGRSSVGRAAGLYPACRGFESFRPDLRGRAVRQLARFIPWRSQVQILLSLCCHNNLLCKAPVERWGLFFC